MLTSRYYAAHTRTISHKALRELDLVHESGSGTQKMRFPRYRIKPYGNTHRKKTNNKPLKQIDARSSLIVIFSEKYRMTIINKVFPANQPFREMPTHFFC